VSRFSRQWRLEPPKPRITDFPYRKWSGLFFRFLKTFDILFFRVLQFFELYRPQKSILGIPSFATKDFALLQAAVYNGTQEEVLGFRPRRLLHRLLKGVPDLEMFEAVRFQLAVSEKALRSVEVSTETRGFINVEMPWQIPWELPKVSWLRIRPLGVDTVVGRVEIGNYEVISSPVFFLTNQVKWVVISDIDDTIKSSNVAETTSVRSILASLFKGHYYRYEAIEGMADLYKRLAAKGAMIVYLTSTPYQLTPFLLKFLRDCQFPEGPVFPRWLGYNRFGHKIRTLRRLLNHVSGQRCALIGDSGEQDLQIYRRLCESSQFGSHVERILIRHVPGSALPPMEAPREVLYKTIPELERELSFILES
jgi:hypothetical protein